MMPIVITAILSAGIGMLFGAMITAFLLSRPYNRDNATVHEYLDGGFE